MIYRGFRSSFDRGCLSLWFNFRRNVSLFSLSTRLDNDLTACSSTANSYSYHYFTSAARDSTMAPIPKMFVSIVFLEM